MSGLFADRGTLRQGGSHVIRKAVNIQTAEEVAAKVHSDKSSYQKELASLKATNSPCGREYVMQLRGFDDDTRTIYLELANASLGQLLAHKPQGMQLDEVKLHTRKILDALLYLHGTQVAHLDIKPENLLIYGFEQKLKLGDMDSASRFGEQRDPEATPYTCAPETAAHIRFGGGLRVSASEDVWQLGVTVLVLLTGAHPFVLPESDNLPTKLGPIAALTEADVSAAVRRAGVRDGTQLASFLERCLAIEPAQRASVQELMASGFISGASSTQSVRDGGAAMKSISLTLSTIQDDVKDIKVQLPKVLSGIEAVRATIVNLEQSPVPLVFAIEMVPRTQGARGSAAGFERRFKAIFNAANKMEAVQAALDDLDCSSMTLRLLCQYTWEPVGAGYPIPQPRDTVPKLLPLLEAGLKGMKAVKGVGGLGRMFGLPVPEIPESAIEGIGQMVDELGSAGYACVEEAAAKAGGGNPTSVSRFQQSEFEAFLRKHDPEANWKSQLVRVALISGEVLWVSEAAHATLRAEGRLGSVLSSPQTGEHHVANSVSNSDFEALLTAANLTDYASALRAAGVVEVADIGDVDDSDLAKMGMKKLEIKRLRRLHSDCQNPVSNSEQRQPIAQVCPWHRLTAYCLYIYFLQRNSFSMTFSNVFTACSLSLICPACLGNKHPGIITHYNDINVESDSGRDWQY